MMDIAKECGKTQSEQRPEPVKLKIEDELNQPSQSFAHHQKGQKRLFTGGETVKKRDTSMKHCKYRIILTKQTWSRWNSLKRSLNMDSHSELASLLIDCWFDKQDILKQQESFTDTSLVLNTNLTAENSIKLESEEIKVEVNSDKELTEESLSDDSTDIEYAELVNFMNNMKEKREVHYETVCSEHSDERKIDSNKTICDTEACQTVETNNNKKIYTTSKSPDPDYNPSNDDGTQDKEPHRREKKRLSKSKVNRKEKKLKGTPKNSKNKKAKSPDPKQPWVKIQLTDHEDKYKVEIVESFARMNRKIDASENLYSCLVCQHFKCASRDIFEDHIEKHVNKALECEQCDFVANCETHIREHRWTCCERPRAESVCSICGHWSASSESRRNHLGKAHGIAGYKCIFCPDKFMNRAERLGHMRVAHEESCQYCESCKLSKYLLSKDEYKKHLENCSSTVQCQICGILVNTHSMYKHIRDKHEKIRSHQCHKCPYAAKTTRRLKTHLLSHDKIHPYSCKLCSFTCIQPNQLTSHMRTHTGEKPYKCTQCKYAAAWNVQLKEHVKVHSMGTTVTCEKCDIVFKNERTLNMHLKKEHFK